MLYAKTVAVAIGMALMALMFWSVAVTAVMIYKAKATGTAFKIKGLRESLLLAVALGWLGGTVWYFVLRGNLLHSR
jgi:hypothetical protein